MQIRSEDAGSEDARSEDARSEDAGKAEQICLWVK